MVYDFDRPQCGGCGRLAMTETVEHAEQGRAIADVDRDRVVAADILTR
jgi:hypothetical protein